ncbi:hypothetical protein KM043_018613 [Ampulex compressa]|nr:hypothetical protein KM043_018613 [Ampulex compressa]
MLPTLHCVTSLFCVSLIYDTNSVVYDKLVTKTELDYQNEQNRNNFMLLETQMTYNLDTRLNKIATEVLTNVTNHVLHNITEMINIQPGKDAKDSPCLENAVKFVKAEARIVANKMLPCVSTLHEKYVNFTRKIQTAFKDYSANKVALKKLADTCDEKANDINCYAKPLYNIEKSVRKYPVLYGKLAMQTNQMILDQIPNAENCLKNFLPELNAMAAIAMENAVSCLVDEIAAE